MPLFCEFFASTGQTTAHHDGKNKNDATINPLFCVFGHIVQKHNQQKMFHCFFFCLENWCKKRKLLWEVFTILRQTLKTKIKTLFYIIWTHFLLLCYLLNQWFSVCCCVLCVFTVYFVQKGRRKLIVNCFNDEYDELLELMTSYSAASSPNIDKKMRLSKN